MRSLVITSNPPPVPALDVHGPYKRLGMFVKAIQRMSSQVEFLHLVPEKYLAQSGDQEQTQRSVSEFWGFPVTVTMAPIRRRPDTLWSHYGAGIFSIFAQPEFGQYSGPEQVAAVAACLDRKPDLVFVQYLAGMCPLLQCERPLPRVFLDFDSVEHMLRLRSAFSPPVWPGKLVYAAHAPAILAAEWTAAARARVTSVCSERDRRHLRRLGIRSNIVVVPNALAVPAKVEPLPKDKTLMFIGVYDYPPNAKAVERLLDRIWPMIHQRLPDARLLIAGKGGEYLPVFKRRVPGVEFLGFVPDVSALYARSRVVCCPLVVGAGTRIKLIEAAAYGRPMVSTRIGAEGLAFVSEEEILLRDDDVGFANACVRLLEDDDLCHRLASAARSRMQSLYDVSQIEERIEQLMRETA